MELGHLLTRSGLTYPEVIIIIIIIIIIISPPQAMNLSPKLFPLLW